MILLRNLPKVSPWKGGMVERMREKMSGNVGCEAIPLKGWALGDF